ncbi:hypothetical protein [Arabiibacter massiliensis]|uniref:hypothetical protein n=1 Tax=Arabiibacter massiliensis TaxID=1870985 RepID=UPI0009BC136A|nr:hypothetical protein [Arabiibacter massiliensis]
MFASAAFRTPRRLVFSAALLVALVLGLPGAASAATEGPFDVSGPKSSYLWDGSTLTISGDGVAIEGMSSPDAPAGAVVVNANVSKVGIGSNVRIGTLTVKRSTTFVVTGTDNEVVQVDTARDDAVGGDGKITLETDEAAIDVFNSATVRVDGEIMGAYVWQKATLVLGPQAKVTGSITALGGILDLSQVAIGQPIPVGGVSVGTEATLALAAPFGATDLHQLLAYDDDRLFVNEPTPVYEDGENIGTLNKDGSFNITATREVAFVGFDGAPLATETVKLFGAATAPKVTAPDGYEFAGWDRAFDYVTENMTVAAQFDEIPAPAPAPDNGGTASGSASSSELERPALHQRVASQGKLAKTGDPLGPKLAVAVALAAGALVASGAALARRR